MKQSGTLLVICLLAIVVSHSAFALQRIALPSQAPFTIPVLFGLNKKEPPLPEQFYIHDEATFKENTKPYHRIPFNDANLEFDIQLPTTWTSEQFQKSSISLDLAQGILGDAARFKSPLIGTIQAVVTIQSVTLPYEISAENWLKNYVFMNGFSVQGDVAVISNKKAGVSYVSTHEGRINHTYAVFQISGKMGIMAKFEIPFSHKDVLGFLQKRSIDSFRLFLTTDLPVENQKNLTLADALKFDYPASWNMHYPDYRDPQNMSVQIHNEASSAGKVEGLIRFLAIHRNSLTTLKKETGKIKKYFDEFLGLKFKKLVSSEKAPVYDRFIFSRQEVYEVESKNKNAAGQEVRLVALGDKDWYIFVFLLTPTKDTDLATWARNTQSFDLIVKSLR